MISCSFDRALVPANLAHWECIYGACFSINAVPEDEGPIERNDLLISAFDVLDKIWKAYQQAKYHAEYVGLELPPSLQIHSMVIQQTGYIRLIKGMQLNLPARCVVELAVPISTLVCLISSAVASQSVANKLIATTNGTQWTWFKIHC